MASRRDACEALGQDYDLLRSTTGTAWSLGICFGVIFAGFGGIGRVLAAIVAATLLVRSMSNFKRFQARMQARIDQLKRETDR